MINLYIFRFLELGKYNYKLYIPEKMITVLICKHWIKIYNQSQEMFNKLSASKKRKNFLMRKALFRIKRFIPKLNLFRASRMNCMSISYMM